MSPSARSSATPSASHSSAFSSTPPRYHRLSCKRVAMSCARRKVRAKPLHERDLALVDMALLACPLDADDRYFVRPSVRVRHPRNSAVQGATGIRSRMDHVPCRLRPGSDDPRPRGRRVVAITNGMRGLSAAKCSRYGVRATVGMPAAQNARCRCTDLSTTSKVAPAAPSMRLVSSNACGKRSLSSPLA